MRKTTLGGFGVLVTRPAHQAEGLCALIERHGGRALRLPVIDIVAAEQSPKLERVIASLPTCDIALFISGNAVQIGVPLVKKMLGAWPAKPQVGAVGKATAQQLAAAGLTLAMTPPEEFSSEGLLALPALQQLSGKRVVIFRGVGGREALADEMRARGAEVAYAEVYERRRPRGGIRDALPAEERGAIGVIIVTSNEGVENLIAMAGDDDRAWLFEKQLVVVGPRTAQRAKELGFVRPAVIAAQASDEGLVAAVQRWHEQQHNAG